MEQQAQLLSIRPSCLAAGPAVEQQAELFAQQAQLLSSRPSCLAAGLLVVHRAAGAAVFSAAQLFFSNTAKLNPFSTSIPTSCFYFSNLRLCYLDCINCLNIAHLELFHCRVSNRVSQLSFNNKSVHYFTLPLIF